MKKTIAVIALLLLPTAAIAQRPRAERGQQQPQNNAVELVLEQKAKLNLTTEQVTKLQTFAKQLEEKNKPTIEQIQKLRESGTRARDMSEEQRAAMRKLMDTIQANRKAAMDSVRTVLSDEQKKALKELLEEQRPRRRR